MSSFWDQVLQLFGKAEASTSQQPAVHELIERDEESRERYEHWKSSFVMGRMLDWLREQYAVFLLRPDEVDEGLDFLDTPSSKGFVVHFYKTNYRLEEATHFLDYLKERTLTLDYKAQLSDVRTYSQSQWVERMERHYLKPRPRFDEAGKQAQQYGNVLIELEVRDERAYQLRFRATAYRDHNYSPAADFGGLMGVILA